VIALNLAGYIRWPMRHKAADWTGGRSSGLFRVDKVGICATEKQIGRFRIYCDLEGVGVLNAKEVTHPLRRVTCVKCRRLDYIPRQLEEKPRVFQALRRMAKAA